MQGNYQGTAPYLISPLMAVTNNWPGVQYALGTSINDLDTSGFAAALAAANSSEHIIVCAGIDTSIEAEGNDGPATRIPVISSSSSPNCLNSAKSWWSSDSAVAHWTILNCSRIKTSMHSCGLDILVKTEVLP